jgi:uncharacterized protein YndB with AHSA1/START domain
MEPEHDSPDVHATVLVEASPERAFDLFTVGLGEWWMPEYTWSGPLALSRIGIEPRANGMCYEIGPHGFRMDWGRVLTWDPPDRLVFTWQISPERVPEPDPDRASEVEVRFTPEGAGSRVDLTHRGFDRHGGGAQAYRGGMSVGWEQLLGRFADCAGKSPWRAG